jgi:hypothetical protein
MKHLQNLFLLFMLALVPMTFTSCGDDDNKTPGSTGGEEGEKSVVPTKGKHSYVMVFTNYSDQINYTKEVKLTFDGNDVVAEGFSDYLPESPIAGKIEGGKLVLPESFLGTYQKSAYMEPMDIDFKGATFEINKTTGVFTSKDGFFTMSGTKIVDRFLNITLYPVVERAATPATPTCEFAKFNTGTMFVVNMNIPLFDTENRAMLTEKLSYMLYYEKNGEVSPITFTPDLYTKLTAPMTEIPYNFSDQYDIDNYQVFMNQGKEELKTWTRVGVQSIYRGGGEVNKSEIAWYDMSNFKW